jgi:hypothetical protein
MLSSGYAISYQKGKRYVHRAIFYLNKHQENNINCIRKRFNLPMFLARKWKDIRGAGGGGVGAGSGGVEGMANG